MAEVVDMSIRIQDAKNEFARTHLYFPAAATIAQLQAYSNEYLPLLNAGIEGYITGVQVTHNLTVDHVGLGLRTTPVANSDVQEGANLLTDVANSNYNFSIRIPALLQAAFTNRSVNLGHAAIAALIAHIAAGDGTLTARNRTGDDLVVVLSGKKTFHK